MAATATQQPKQTEKLNEFSDFEEFSDKDVPRWEKGKYRVDWISVTVLFIPPLLVAWALLTGVPFQTKTVIIGLIFYAMNGLGITMGYHRLFSHRGYSAVKPMEWVMLVWGAGAFQGSAKWWGRNHRIHHRYVDTDKDPYNALRGFWFSHMGWMLMKQDYSLLGRVDVSDFKASKSIMFQHNHYLEIASLCGVIAPAVIAGLGWGDWAGGFFYAALLKMVVVHHTTFFINSLAHTPAMGAIQHYSDKHSSYDSPICAFLTLGEGYHNFHHEFAQDYRNGILWWHYDPTKWLIRLCEILGWAYNLVRVPNQVISRNICEMDHRKHAAAMEAARQKIEALEKKVSVPTYMSWVEFEEEVKKGRKLMVIGNYVLDVSKKVQTGSGYTHHNVNVDWYESHPGGKRMLDYFIGKDATDAVSGGIYKHHEGALNLFHHLRVAHIVRDSKKKSN